MNWAEREITCSGNDCFPRRESAGGYAAHRWKKNESERERGGGWVVGVVGGQVCLAPTGLQLVCAES